MWPANSLLPKASPALQELIDQLAPGDHIQIATSQFRLPEFIPPSESHYMLFRLVKTVDGQCRIDCLAKPWRPEPSPGAPGWPAIDRVSEGRRF